VKRCLDTTFLSLAVRSDPGALKALRGWAEDGETVATTEVNYYEVALGIELIAGRPRKDRLAQAWGELLTALEVLPLTRRVMLTAVRRQGELFRSGRPAALADLLIAAAANVGRCDLIVTRDIADFERVGLLRTERH
jgi:predicted nucleic acid-binding protein